MKQATKFNKAVDDILATGIHKAFGTQFVKNQVDVNIITLEDGYIIDFSLVGLDKEDIDLKLEENHLVVSTSRTCDHKDTTLLKTEYCYDNSLRKVLLPKNADATSIKAAYKNGILSVHLNIKEAASPTKATIKIK